MLPQQAEELLAKSPLTVAAEGSAPTVRALLAQCLEQDLPAVIGPCEKSG